MLGLNRPATNYPIIMTWYQSEDNSKGIQKFSSTGIRFHCNYAKSSDIVRLNLNQGVQSQSMILETASPLQFRINDKILYNGKAYIIKSVSEDNNPVSGGMWSNKSNATVKFLEIN